MAEKSRKVGGLGARQPASRRNRRRGLGLGRVLQAGFANPLGGVVSFPYWNEEQSNPLPEPVLPEGWLPPGMAPPPMPSGPPDAAYGYAPLWQRLNPARRGWRDIET